MLGEGFGATAASLGLQAAEPASGGSATAQPDAPVVVNEIPTIVLSGVGVLLVVGAVAFLVVRWRTLSRKVMGGPRADAQATTPTGPPSLKATNAAGRRGSFHLPDGHQAGPLPLMVAIHGEGGSGAAMVEMFRAAADKERFFVVAPDSGGAGGKLAAPAAESGHVRKCLDEVLAMPGVQVDPGRTLVVGYAEGASTAAHVATTDAFYTALAVLHGAPDAAAFGKRKVRAWFSTGTQDTAQPPAKVREGLERAKGAGMDAVVYREFLGAHEVGTHEAPALLEWWLKK